MIKKSSEYQRIIVSAQESLAGVIDVDNKNYFLNPIYIDSAKLDDVVFLNKGGDKCLLLILQKTSKDVKSDQIRILHGARVNGKWLYFANRMPRVPQMTYSIAKPIKGSVLVNNSFKSLSDKGRDYILNFGSVSNQNCNIDCKFWFGE